MVRPIYALSLIAASLFAVGCSTHPCVDVCDFFKPGRLYPNKVTPYGGVCAPLAGSVNGTAPSAGGAPMAGPIGPVIPPPVPVPPGGGISVPTLPNPAPPGSVVPVPSTGGVPPPPNFPVAPPR